MVRLRLIVLMAGIAIVSFGQSLPDGAAALAIPTRVAAVGRHGAAAAGTSQKAAPGRQAKDQAKNPPPPDKDVGKCVSADDLDANDPDVSRNAHALASSDLCLKLDAFAEAGLRWVLMIIQNKRDPDRILWMVPHDNEDDAFDNAVAGVTRYGGTVVAVKTNGNHYNGLQDPNRNFDLGGGAKCGKQRARSPVYTGRVMRWHRAGAPIIALHTNEQGYKGDGQGGLYGISVAQPIPGTIAFRATVPPLGASPNDTMVFVASRSVPEQDPGLMAFVNALRAQGVNMMYELVKPERNDCSLSNYATLKGMRDYVNVEVVRTDGATEARIVDLVMSLMGDSGIRRDLPATAKRGAESGATAASRRAPRAVGR
jgi:hypothetical protein